MLHLNIRILHYVYCAYDSKTQAIFQPHN